MATEITYVGAGTASATDGGSAPTPTLPAGLADDDLMITFFYSREAVDGTVAINPGGDWTQIFNQLTSAGLIGIWYRFRVAGDAAPTFTLGNHAGGATGDDAIAQVAAWRGVSPSNPIGTTGILTTFASQQNIGAIPGVEIDRNGLAVVFGGKMDDWTSVAVLSGDGLTWNEIGEPDSTAGNDAGMVWDYAISSLASFILSSKTFTVSGGASALSVGVMVTFNLDPDPFVAADHIVAYCAQAHPTVDSGMVGGLPNTLMRAVFTDLAADDDVEVLSSDAADTLQSITVRGRDASNDIVQETASLNGTTPVILSTLGVIDRIESVELSGPCIGTITVRRSVGGALIGEIPPNEIGFRRIFAYAYPLDTVAKDYYEKIFLRNNHNYYTIANALVEETSDPVGDLTFLLDGEKDSASVIANRTTVPDVVDTLDPDIFDNLDKYAPTGYLDPLEAIGVWIKMPISAAEAEFKNTYQLTLSGDVDD